MDTFQMTPISIEFFRKWLYNKSLKESILSLMVLKTHFHKLKQITSFFGGRKEKEKKKRTEKNEDFHFDLSLF